MFKWYSGGGNVRSDPMTKRLCACWSGLPPVARLGNARLPEADVAASLFAGCMKVEAFESEASDNSSAVVSTPPCTTPRASMTNVTWP